MVQSKFMRFLLSACLLVSASAAPALAQDKPVNLKLSTWIPPSHPLHPVIKEWSDSIAKDSNGTITATLFTSQQLGKATDHYDMARDGIADFAYVNPGYQPGRFPVVSAAELPFLAVNGKDGSVAFDGWYREYAAKEMGDVHFCLGFLSEPGGLHARKKYMVPDDMKGLKLGSRNWTNANFVTLLGGSNVQVSAPESRDVLERGVADAVFFPWGSLILFGLDKVSSEHLDLPLYSTTNVWVMNKSRYNAMSDAQKKVIDKHCTNEWAQKFATPWAEFEAGGRAKIAAMPGHHINTPTTEQAALWRKAAEPLVAKWAEPVRKKGLDPDKILEAYKSSLVKNKALY